MSDQTRRDVLKRAFVAPAILTLAAVPSYASAGSSSHVHEDQGHHYGWLKDKKD